MPTTTYHGLAFTFAEQDGELLDLDIDSTEEFMAHHWDEAAFDGLLGVTDRHILDYAEAHLVRDAYEDAGFRPTWTEAEQRGCSNVTGRP